MTKRLKNNIKNILLSLSYFIGLVPKLYFGTEERMFLSLTHARGFTTRLDFVALFYTNTINFLILAFCLHFNKGIDKRLTNFILWICVLDFFHLLIFAKQGFGVSKVFIAFCIVIFYELYKKHKWKNGNN